MATDKPAGIPPLTPVDTDFSTMLGVHQPPIQFVRFAEVHCWVWSAKHEEHPFIVAPSQVVAVSFSPADPDGLWPAHTQIWVRATGKTTLGSFHVAEPVEEVFERLCSAGASISVGRPATVEPEEDPVNPWRNLEDNEHVEMRWRKSVDGSDTVQ